MKTLVSAAAVAAIAGSAFGLGESLDRSSYPIYTTNTPGITLTAQPIHVADRGPLAGWKSSVYGWDDSTPTSGPVPGSIFGSGAVAAPASSYLGAEDYGTTLDPFGPPNGTPTSDFATFTAFSYQFVGGVTSANQILFFDFFFNNFSYGNGFGIQFPSGGNFIWTITFDPTGFVIPTEGFHQIAANTDANIGPISTGRWFLADSGADPTIGHNDLAWDSGQFDYGSGSVNIGYLFALATPTPGTVGLMGLAGLAGASRRRRR